MHNNSSWLTLIRYGTYKNVFQTENNIIICVCQLQLVFFFLNKQVFPDLNFNRLFARLSYWKRFGHANDMHYQNINEIETEIYIINNCSYRFLSKFIHHDHFISFSSQQNPLNASNVLFSFNNSLYNIQKTKEKNPITNRMNIPFFAMLIITFI